MTDRVTLARFGEISSVWDLSSCQGAVHAMANSVMIHKEFLDNVGTGKPRFMWRTRGSHEARHHSWASKVSIMTDMLPICPLGTQ